MEMHVLCSDPFKDNKFAENMSSFKLQLKYPQAKWEHNTQRLYNSYCVQSISDWYESNM